MDEPKRKKPDDETAGADENDARELGDMADAAQRQMPGRPPLAIDPAKPAGKK